MRLVGIALAALAAGLAAWFGPATPLGAVIFAIHPPFLNTFQAVVQRRISPDLWNEVLLPLLEWPSWVIPLVLAVLFLVLGWRRRRHG